jgi:hypothetical protein
MTLAALSDRALRRLAWGLWWFLSAMSRSRCRWRFLRFGGRLGRRGLAGEASYLVIAMTFRALVCSSCANSRATPSGGSC